LVGLGATVALAACVGGTVGEAIGVAVASGVRVAAVVTVALAGGLALGGTADGPGLAGEKTLQASADAASSANGQVTRLMRA
jgi:hypothetical protein